MKSIGTNVPNTHPALIFNFVPVAKNKFFSSAKANRKWCEILAGRKRLQGLRGERTDGQNLSFPAPFFGSFFGRTKNEQDNNLK